MYRGYPLVRKGNEIYYGYMSEPFVVMMQIVHQQEVNGLKVADKIRVYQIATKEPDPVKAITKTSDRPNLYEAVDLANVWLKRAEKDAAAKYIRFAWKRASLHGSDPVGDALFVWLYF